jgi:hypothetical protein
VLPAAGFREPWVSLAFERKRQLCATWGFDQQAASDHRPQQFQTRSITPICQEKVMVPFNPWKQIYEFYDPGTRFDSMPAADGCRIRDFRFGLSRHQFIPCPSFRHEVRLHVQLEATEPKNFEQYGAANILPRWLL